MSGLDQDEIDFLHACARHGPTGFTSDLAHSLEKRGYVEFVYEGASLQGKWRLTPKGREAAQSRE